MNLRNFTHEADYHVQMCVYVFGWRMVSHCDESVINYCCYWTDLSVELDFNFPCLHQLGQMQLVAEFYNGSDHDHNWAELVIIVMT